MDISLPVSISHSLTCVLKSSPKQPTCTQNLFSESALGTSELEPQRARLCNPKHVCDSATPAPERDRGEVTGRDGEQAAGALGSH